jgi:hypothetical protein
MTKILIEISDGMVDTVLCDDPEADLLVLDHDVDVCDDEELEEYHNLLSFADKFRTGLLSIY